MDNTTRRNISINIHRNGSKQVGGESTDILIHSQFNIPIGMILVIIFICINGMTRLTEKLCTNNKNTEVINKCIPINHKLIILMTNTTLIMNKST